MDESTILRAERYVTKANQIVASQRDRIERLRGGGYDTLEAEQTLRVFEKSLRTFEDYRDWLLLRVVTSSHEPIISCPILCIYGPARMISTF